MNKKSKELFTESIKQAILQHVGLFESPCEPLDGFESFIFKVRYKGEPCALRISHSMHRSPVQIRGEIEWLQHLASHQLNVPSVLPFPNGEYLASISDGNGGALKAWQKEGTFGHLSRRPCLPPCLSRWAICAAKCIFWPRALNLSTVAVNDRIGMKSQARIFASFCRPPMKLSLRNSTA